MENEKTDVKGRILILFAHPALQKSRFNIAMINAVKVLDGVTVHNLYENYPEFDIDIDHEQKLAEANDIILLHHPLFWYSAPAIIKEWFDMVLEHDWAYGHNGTALHGKKLMQVVTTGGREEAYTKDGLNGATIREVLLPFAMSARLCGMEYLPPFVIHGTHSLGEEDIELAAEEYRLTVMALRDGAIDFEKAKELVRINSNFPLIIKTGANRS